MSKNELTATNFTDLQNFNLADALTEEMAGMDVRFDRIKIPVGGGLVFEVPGDGEPEIVKEFSGVILYHHPLTPAGTTRRTAAASTASPAWETPAGNAPAARSTSSAPA